MTSSIPSTPNVKPNLKSTPKRLCTRSLVTVETPECFTNVTVETTKIKKRTSKDKPEEISNLKVAVRVRPINSREWSCSSVYNAVTVDKNEVTVKSLVASHGVGTNHIFQYDHVFWSVDPEKPEFASQSDVYSTIASPLLENAFRGYNACLFAYGQTGSGKSYSMMGDNSGGRETEGIIPRFCCELFKRKSELPDSCNSSVKISYFEIYNEKIHDLLATSKDNKINLKVREHQVLGPYVQNLSQHHATSYGELKEWLELGNKQRATAANIMNEKSSRSHSIFSIELSLDSNSKDGRQSKISLVDLAGSERLGSVNVNDELYRQGVSINRSLLVLGKVISALADQKRSNFVPYRDSILTWLLRESLGGNSLTSMLATISPASTHTEETLATLRYACQARSIINRAYINEDPHNRLIRELRAEIEQLRAIRNNYTQEYISISQNEDSVHEVEDLRVRLSETTNRMENVMKQKEELESHVKNMGTAVLSPYKSNFLQDLEDVLAIERDIDANDIENPVIFIDNIQKLCRAYGHQVELVLCSSTEKISIKNTLTNQSAVCDLNYLHTHFKSDNVDSFLEDLEWKFGRISRKSITKDEIQKYLRQIQGSVDEIKNLVAEDCQLSKSFGLFTKALQVFENAVMKNRNRSPCKSVTFNL